MSFDVADIITGILPALGAVSQGDLDWVTASELYHYADEAAKRLAHRCAVFVDVDNTTAVTGGVAQYATLPGFVDMLRATLGAGALRESSAGELGALDSAWQQTTGAPSRYSMDAGPLGTVTLYPAPIAAGTLEQIFHQFPEPAIALGASVVNAPAPVQEFFAYSMLAEARRKESDRRMEEMADHFDERARMLEQLIEHYWGAAQ